MKRISKRTREQAIEICEQRHDVSNETHSFGYMCDQIGASAAAQKLAWDAREAVVESGHAIANVEVHVIRAIHAYRWLEAAALLRDGWCPGDPVVRL